MRPSPGSTVVTAAFVLQLMMSAHGYHVLRVWSDYDKQYALLKTVSENDMFWESVFRQSVYVNLANMRFRKIIDKELLKGAEVPLETADGGDSDNKPVSPKVFFNNVMVSDRKKIGTVVDMTVEVLKTALTCLAYKDTIILMTLFRVEITREIDERRLVKRAGMANMVVVTILTMMSAMQFTNEWLMEAVRFFTVVVHEKDMVSEKRYKLLPFSDKLVDNMMEYVKENCVNPVTTQFDIAKELKLNLNDNLFTNSNLISKKVFKDMFYSTVMAVKQHYEKLGLNTGMSTDPWNDILHFRPMSDKMSWHYNFGL